MSLFDVIDDALFDIHWHFTVERDVNKSMKRFGDTMDKAIKVLDDIADGSEDSKIKNLVEKLPPIDPVIEENKQPDTHFKKLRWMK